MGGVSQIAERVRLPLEIRTASYLKDHRFQGRAVLPAVHAMQRLAVSALAWQPDLNVRALKHARFSRFLYLNFDDPIIPAINEIERKPDGGVVSRLLTKMRSEKSGITRIHTHVELEFPIGSPEPTPPPADELFSLQGIGCDIQPDEIYGSLVPFGPSFQNIAEPLMVTAHGAITTVKAPDHGASVYPLGSPFPLDAAFHAACVWGQRYHGIVGFPVALEARHLFRPTKTGDTYLARILPRKSSHDRPVFDIWITDTEGTPHEAALGVMMQDVSAGRMTPPDWIAHHRPDDQSVDQDLRPLSGAGSEHCVMELSAVKRAAVKALSQGEYERFQELGRRRQKPFLGARLCLKRLSRMLSGHDDATPATAIHTIDSDRVRPRCPLTDGTNPYFCSVSHDQRFVVALASGSPVGVDVERLTDKVVESRRIYMHEAERSLTDRSPLGKTDASLRVWSVKEAMAKAFGMTLAEAWDRVTVKEIGETRSRVSLDENTYDAVHHQVADHVFTLVDTGLE